MTGPASTGEGEFPPLGAHVSIAGGISEAPARAVQIGATTLQIFTKQPQRWAEPTLADDEVAAFTRAVREADLHPIAVHDSYLINLASRDPALFKRSRRAFEAELERCQQLGADFLVTHPGNATGGDRQAALRQNGTAIAAALDRHPGRSRVLIETTAGSGSALGWRFEELAGLIDRIGIRHRDRIGVCFDTAHVFAAGYDLRDDFDGVIAEFDSVVGLDRLALFHVNDSRAARGSRVDRHADIGKGCLGKPAFAALMQHAALRAIPRIIETPKGSDATAADRRNLDRLRSLGSAALRTYPAR